MQTGTKHHKDGMDDDVSATATQTTATLRSNRLAWLFRLGRWKRGTAQAMLAVVGHADAVTQRAVRLLESRCPQHRQSVTGGDCARALVWLRQRTFYSRWPLCVHLTPPACPSGHAPSLGLRGVPHHPAPGLSPERGRCCREAQSTAAIRGTRDPRLRNALPVRPAPAAAPDRR